MEPGQRRQWQRGDIPLQLPKEQSPPVKEEIPDKYDEYLLLLQQKNRVLKKMKAKDDKQIELEQKEQGFSLYVNGANTRLGIGGTLKHSPRRPNTKKPLTAGDKPRRPVRSFYGYQEEEKEEQGGADPSRAKTAPSKVQRRNWLQQSFDIKTSDGEKLRVKSRKGTNIDDGGGEYDDDEFEIYESMKASLTTTATVTQKRREMPAADGIDQDDYDNITKNLTLILEGPSDGDSDNEEDAEQFKKDSADHRQRRDGKGKFKMEEDDDDDDEDESSDHLLLSIEDVKMLRRSLEANADIRRSITCHQQPESDRSPSSSEGEDEEEDIRDSSKEAEEDIEEDIEILRDSLDQDVRLEPGDMIVLEFASLNKGPRQQVLSAKRKPDVDEVAMVPRQARQGVPGGHSNIRKPAEIKELRAGSAPSSSRPLSSQKKRSDRDWQALDDLSAIQRAIKAENEAAAKKATSGSRSASPQQIAKVSSPLPLQQVAPRSSSVASSDHSAAKPEPVTALTSTQDLMSSQNLDEHKVALVLEKVKQMDARSQRKLLVALGKVEDSATKAGDEATPVNTPRQEGGGTWSDMPKGEGDTDRSAMFTTPMLAPRAKSVALTSSSQQAPPTAELTSSTEVSLLATTNWGHPDRIGLTDVQFFDLNGKRIGLNAEQVKVVGSYSEVKGDIGCVVNGKAKTTKERNMWSCCYQRGQSLELVFSVPTTRADISRIDIWNYNKSLKELSIGLKDLKIFIEGRTAWEGEIDKGCGNQVFDYNTTININNSDQGTVTSSQDYNKHERALAEQRDTQQQLQKNNNGSHDNTQQLSDQIDRELFSKEGVPPPKVSAAANVPRPSAKTDREAEAGRPEFTRSKTKILKCSSDNIKIPVVDESVEIYATPRASSKSPTRKPPEGPSGKHVISGRATVVLKERADDYANSPPEPEGEDQNTEEPSMMKQLQSITRPSQRPKWLRPSCDKHTNGSKPKKKSKRPPWLSNFTGQEDDKSLEPEQSSELISEDKKQDNTLNLLADDLEDTRWRQRGVSVDESDPEEDGARRRAQWQSHRELSLEESWSSLNLFNKSQMGRISANINADIVGDSLDDYVSGLKSKQPEEPKDDSSDEFEIPLLPMGQKLTLNIRTTWGDKHYVGLNGIEIYKSDGEPVNVVEIFADPSDINILPAYGRDPRVVSNLIDGINRTRDDTHMWLAPYTPGAKHLIHVTFESLAKVAMIRIWNYNKSRIHSFRGARDIEILLDGNSIFKGEIERASGIAEGETDSFGDTILFTEDEEILELISRHDEAYVAEEDWFSSSQDEEATPRPKTADQGEERPMTQARMFREKKSTEEKVLIDEDPHRHRGFFPDEDEDEGELKTPTPIQAGPRVTADKRDQDESVFTCRHLKLNFTATWGDMHYLGLTGLDVLDPEGDAIPLTVTMVDAKPRDLNHLPGYGTDDRTLDKLINGANVTTSDEHMWLIPFNEGEDHLVTIDFGREVQTSGLRIWNYNKSPEDTYRGAKIVHVFMDNRQISPSEGYLIRKGSGFCYFDSAQEISFSGYKSSPMLTQPSQAKVVPDALRQSLVAMERPSQEYVPMHMPCGFVFQLQLISTWGDPYYIGLNGLEFYDANGDKIPLTETNIAAYPCSVNVLEDVMDDVRTPDKLIDGINDTSDGSHMWLAPILPHVINRVYIIFDQPLVISMIKLWNYSKTPHRGVKEFGLLVDDLLVYNGILGQVINAARGILPSLDIPTPYHTIIFTENEQLRRKERHTIIHNSPHDQDVKMTNDYHVMANYSNPKKQTNKPADQAMRPKTSVPSHGGIPTRRR